MGKTSLLARGLQQARGQGVSVVLTDFQELNTSDFESLEKFYLALGDSLGVQLAISFKQISALEARPALVAIMIATVLCLDYRCHRLPPLPKPLLCENWRAKDGEVAT